MTELFITATDTGVGKTTVGRALLAAAREAGMTALCMKPAESGCADNDGLQPADAISLQQAAGGTQSLDEICLYRFEEPVAPGVAAARTQQSISLRRIITVAERHRLQEPQLLVVEGAGGILVPFGQGQSVADVAVALEMPILIVARDGLGTINHTLLTIDYARRRGLAIRGFVFSATGNTTDREATQNAVEITRASHVEHLGTLRRLADGFSDEELAAVASQDLDLQRIFGPVTALRRVHC
jgi:dethiobiotin synthetase